MREKIQYIKAKKKMTSKRYEFIKRIGFLYCFILGREIHDGGSYMTGSREDKRLYEEPSQ